MRYAIGFLNTVKAHKYEPSYILRIREVKICQLHAPDVDNNEHPTNLKFETAHVYVIL